MVSAYYLEVGWKELPIYGALIFEIGDWPMRLKLTIDDRLSESEFRPDGVYKATYYSRLIIRLVETVLISLVGLLDLKIECFARYRP